MTDWTGKIRVRRKEKQPASALRAVLAGTVALCMALGGFTACRGGEPAVEEYRVKAACLYNFLKFVEWPETSVAERDSLVVIGIVGEDPFGEAFDPVEGKLMKPKDTRLVIRRFGPYKKGIDLSACHMLFIAPSETPNISKIIKGVEDSPVLTVGDTEGFLEAGGIINLVTTDERVRWEIHRAPADINGLKFSSQLLRNALRVIEGPSASSERDKR